MSLRPRDVLGRRGRTATSRSRRWTPRRTRSSPRGSTRRRPGPTRRSPPRRTRRRRPRTPRPSARTLGIIGVVLGAVGIIAAIAALGRTTPEGAEPPAMLAHAGAVDESLSVVLLFGALWVGWAGWSRLKGRASPACRPGRWPARCWSWSVALASAPPSSRGRCSRPPRRARDVGRRRGRGPPRPPRCRSSSRPPVEIVAGDELEVVLDLQGGRIVDGASTTLTPDTGHVHLVARRNARLHDLRTRAGGRPARPAPRRRIRCRPSTWRPTTARSTRG